MKQKAGFTLVELIVAMLVSTLVLGSLVALFGGSIREKSVGEKQQIAYAEARWALNEIKTTLRYATPSTIKPQAPQASTTQLVYECLIHKTPKATDDNQKYRMEIKWKDATKKQIVLTKTDITGSEKIEYVKTFPSAGQIAMSNFQQIFPVTLVGGDIYEIKLPIQYQFAGTPTPKTENFVTSVRPLATAVAVNDWLPLREQYNQVVDIIAKKKAGTTLTAAEQEIYDAYGSWYYSNDKVRQYLYNNVYNGNWPAVTTTYPLKDGTLETATLYLQPYLAASGNTLDTFLYLGKNVATGQWSSNFIYNHENDKWYFVKNYHPYINAIVGLSLVNVCWSSGSKSLQAQLEAGISDGTWLVEGTEGFTVQKE
ncbi:MAG: prepilin-type N-terminal cleavage/methylation domain-containing protein [Acidaminococcaceae bacterium]